LRAVVHHCQHVYAKARFQRRKLVKSVDDDVGDGAALEINDHADALAVRFVAQVGNAVDLAVVDQGGDFFHQRGLVQPKGNFPDNDGLGALFAVFNFQPAAHLHGAAPSVVSVVKSLARVDKAPGGKIRPLHKIHEVVNAALRVVQQQLQGVAKFAKVVGRNIGGHAHGDAGAAVEQQVGNLGGHDRGFLQRVVVVGAVIHRVFVQVAQKFLGKTRHAHFCVTHGRRGVAVDGAEVALPIHQRIAHGKILRHTHQGVIYRRIAMRVIFTDDVTDDTR